MLAAFEAQYRKNFARTPPDVPIEFLNLRVRVQAAIPGGAPSGQGAIPDAAAAGPDSRQAYFPDAGGFVETPVLSRYALKPGENFNGPAIIEEKESTLIIGPGASVTVAEDFNLVVDVEGEAP